MQCVTYCVLRYNLKWGVKIINFYWWAQGNISYKWQDYGKWGRGREGAWPIIR